MSKNKESTDTGSTFESTTARDLILPLRILVSPMSAFKQLAAHPTAKGLISIVALVIVVSAATLYASATKIVLTVDSQYVNFVASSGFMSWFSGALVTTVFSIALYWLTAAAALALISRFAFKGSKTISLRISLVVFGYLLSVFIILYAVRAIIYTALPPISFPSSTWPPTLQAEKDQAELLIAQNWSPLPTVQLLYYSAWAAFVWLAMLGTIAVKTMQELNWFKAALISVTGFLLTLLLLQLP